MGCRWSQYNFNGMTGRRFRGVSTLSLAVVLALWLGAPGAVAQIDPRTALLETARLGRADGGTGARRRRDVFARRSPPIPGTRAFISAPAWPRTSNGVMPTRNARSSARWISTPG